MYSFSSLHPLPSDSSKGCYIIWVQNTGSQWTMKDNKGPLQWWLSLTRFRHIPISSNNLLRSSDWALKHVERLIFDWYGRGSQILTWHMRYKQRFSPFTFRNTYYLEKVMTIVKKRRFCLESNNTMSLGRVTGRSADLHRSWIPMKGRKPHVITKSWDFLWNAVHNKNTWRIWIQKALRCRTFMSSNRHVITVNLPFSPRLPTLKKMEHLVANVLQRIEISILYIHIVLG